jgi:polar amino acid transport system substrate-binding protein
MLKIWLIVLGLLVGLAPAASRAQVLDRIISDHKIKIGYIASPPSAIKDPNTGDLSGISVDAVRLIFKQINVEPVFVETTWGTFVAGLQSGQFDLCIAGTFATVGRASAVEFTHPVSYLGYSAIVKKGDTRFKTIADFNNPDITIALLQGGASVEYAKEFFPKAKTTLLATGNTTAPFIEVTAGRADVGIEDAWSAARYSKVHPEVTNLFESDPYNVLPIAWTVKRGTSDLLNMMNTSIDWLMVNDRMQGIAAKYGETGRYIVKLDYVPLGTPSAPPK